ncbi:MAG: hypothetical protein ACYC6R_02845 [Anaerolineales bacterium]
MSSRSLFARFLRFIGIVLMGLTGGFTLLGGIGTTCAALFPAKYESMAALSQFQWLYILFVITGIAIGVWGIWATIKLVRGTSDSYWMSVQALIAGVLVGGFHIYMSRILRGKSMPVDAVVYTTILTLAVFLLFRIPYLWQGINFARSDTKNNLPAGDAAAIMLGLLTLTIHYHPIHHGRNTHLGGCELCERVQYIHDGGWDGVIAFGRRDIRQRQPCMGNSKQADSPARKRVKENIPVHLAGMSIFIFPRYQSY